MRCQSRLSGILSILVLAAPVVATVTAPAQPESEDGPFELEAETTTDGSIRILRAETKPKFSLASVTGDNGDADCVWDQWNDWSPCQFTCGGGQAIRTRNIKTMATGNGQCNGDSKEARDCTQNECPVDCVWDDWSTYTDCSQTCGDSTKTRSRDYKQAAQFGGTPCDGSTSETADCNLGVCPVDCKYDDWNPWGGCSKSCGNGIRKRFRNVAVTPNADGRQCGDIGPNFEETACGQNNCPVDCKLTDWSLWTLCDVSCGVGNMRRTRTKEVDSAHGGVACGKTLDEKSCDNGVCPVDCQLGDWSDWGSCDRTCTPDGQPGIKKRFKAVVQAGNEFGLPCPANASSRLQTGECSLAMCPVDCTLTDWTEWSACTVSCGPGLAERYRTITTPAAHGGKECLAYIGGSGNLTYEKKYCSKEVCPVDCVWNDWQDWRGCSTTCGDGTGTRFRSIMTPVMHGGRDCDQTFSQNRVCNPRICPVHCEWNEWSEWTECSVSCGDGTTTRNRTVKVDADFGGIPCTGSANAARSCNLKNCPVHCEWKDWEAWTECSTSCGVGQQTRKREIAVEPLYGGLVCEGVASDQRECPNSTVCPTDCEWDVWSDWQACSVSCGAGVSTRSRQRKQYEKDGGHTCWGTEDDERNCELNACPVDCVMGDWTAWSTCSATCGPNGTVSRLRGVKIKPLFGGEACSDKLEDDKECPLDPCPVDCQWTDWDPWSPCSDSCNGGSFTRLRREQVAQAFGGIACQGAPSEDGICNQQGCPVDCTWTPWSEWGSCSLTCGGGIRKKIREIQRPASWGGVECENGSNGPANEIAETCNELPCPVDCLWSSWTHWSTCTKTCGSGTSNRTRTKSPAEAYGGKACSSDASEDKYCNTQGCDRDCQWSEWSTWSLCSKHCGGGEIKRFRDVAVTRKFGGSPCYGKSEQGAPCNDFACPIDCEWDEWDDWSSCTVSCNGGQITRHRYRKQIEKFGGMPCVGNETERDDCNGSPCPIDCQFGEWGEWGLCSTSCGIGTRFRTRVKMEAQFGGLFCEGSMMEKGDCGSDGLVEGCPTTTTTTSTTTTPLDWGDRVVTHRDHDPQYFKGVQGAIPRPWDLHKNFSDVPKDPSYTQNMTPPCTSDELKMALDKYAYSKLAASTGGKADPKWTQAIDDVIKSLTGAFPNVDLTNIKDPNLRRHLITKLLDSARPNESEAQNQSDDALQGVDAVDAVDAVKDIDADINGTNFSNLTEPEKTAKVVESTKQAMATQSMNEPTSPSIENLTAENPGVDVTKVFMDMIQYIEERRQEAMKEVLGPLVRQAHEETAAAWKEFPDQFDASAQKDIVEKAVMDSEKVGKKMTAIAQELDAAKKTAVQSINEVAAACVGVLKDVMSTKPSAQELQQAFDTLKEAVNVALTPEVTSIDEVTKLLGNIPNKTREVQAVYDKLIGRTGIAEQERIAAEEDPSLEVNGSTQSPASDTAAETLAKIAEQEKIAAEVNGSTQSPASDTAAETLAKTAAQSRIVEHAQAFHEPTLASGTAGTSNGSNELIKSLKNSEDSAFAPKSHPNISEDLVKIAERASSPDVDTMVAAFKDHKQDGKAVIAEVGGDLVLKINPTSVSASAVANSKDVKDAMQKVIADLAAMGEDTVKVTLSSSDDREDEVNVTYLIEVVDGSGPSDSIMDRLGAQSVGAVTEKVQSKLHSKGLDYSPEAEKLTVTLLPVTGDPDSIVAGATGAAQRAAQLTQEELLSKEAHKESNAPRMGELPLLEANKVTEVPRLAETQRHVQEVPQETKSADGPAMQKTVATELKAASTAEASTALRTRSDDRGLIGRITKWFR